MFWVAALSGMFNCLFLADFVTTAYTGSSIAGILFGTENPVVGTFTEYIPGMTPWEFFLANVFIVTFVSIVMTLSIYVAFYSDRRECYIASKDGNKICGARK